MKIPLLAACFVAGSTWSFASANDQAVLNPKTSLKANTTTTQTVPGKAGKPIFTSKTGQPLFAMQPLGQATAVPLPTTAGVGNADACSSAKSISGAGSFAFDNSLASTGPEGQFESLCLAFGTTDMQLDVWFTWVAPASGVATMDTCGLTVVDTKIAAYPGSGCPTSAALACNDDSCPGFQSTINFPVTGGSSYILQIGVFPGATGGAGSFTMSVAPPITNDDCSSPVSIAGVGSFPFNNATATTGTQGQSEALCLAFGQTAVDNDQWFTWNAPSSGCAVLSVCGGSSVDTKIGVYNGSTCPGASAIACNDDSCGLQSEVRFSVTSGSSYLFQVGTYPGATGGGGTFTLNVTGGGVGQDECASPTVIAGLGTFPFDNSSATTGCEGQGEAICAFYGLPPIDNDIWFQWVAPATGFAIFDTCGLTSVDTKIAIYNGAGCPAPGSSIACNDDTCPGFQSTVNWPVTSGQTYTLQLGTFPGAFGGLGSFSLNVVPPAANDACTAPTVLGPTGPYAFSQLGASTGTQGQTEALCNFFGSTTIDNDVWYTWTAPASGRANLTDCGMTTIDTKIAVYNGSGCPTGSAIGCNDDACPGLQTTVCFDAVGGQTYTIQLGTFPGAIAGSGSFDITLLPPLPPCTHDDGTTENLYRLPALTGDVVWLNRFGGIGQTNIVNSVDVMFGSATFPGFAPANGTPATVCIWTDGVSQDGDPNDSTLLASVNTVTQLVDTETFVTIPFPTLSISGVFFAGVEQAYTSGQFPGPVDEDCANPTVGWEFGDASGTPANLTSPGANPFPPQTFAVVGGVPAVAMVRVSCNAGPATYLCDPGVGTVMNCPCANPPSGSGRGCDNSALTGGASITGAGSNSLGSPSVQFTTANQRPSGTSILLQGTTQLANGLGFGQGVRCAGGVLKRLYVKSAVGGSITAPAGADPTIPTRSATLGDPISPLQDRFYLVYYRDPIVSGGCNPLLTWNCTTTAKVNWQP